MRPLELLQRGVEHRRDQHIGEVAIGIAGLAHADGAGEHPHADEELLLLAEDAGAVEHVLEAARLGQRFAQPLTQQRGVRQRAEEGRVEQRVHHMGAAHDGFGQARRRGQHRHQQVEQAGIGLQQREKLDAGRHAAEEAVEGGEGGIGALAARQGLQENRHELGQPFAGAGRARGGVASEMPAAHRAADFRRVAIAERRERRQRLRVVGVAGERQAADGRGQRRRRLEQRRIAVAHRGQRPGHRLLEGAGVAIAGHAGNDGKPFRVVGERVGLRVGDHLQAMLDRPQRAIGGAQFVAGGAVDPAELGQRLQHVERAPPAQFRLAAAGDQLLGLDEELDLANAAAAELDVVAGDRHHGMAAVIVDLALDRMDVGDGREIQVFAPDIGGEVGEEGVAGGLVAGNGARLDERRALPVLAEALVILQRRLGGDGDVGRARVGPEPEVGAEDIAVGGVFLQQRHQPLGHAHEQCRGLDALADARRASSSKSTIRSMSLE